MLARGFALLLILLLASGAMLLRDPIGRALMTAGLPGLAAIVSEDPGQRGVALDLAGRPAEAAAAFRQSPRSEAAYNLGTVLARAGDYTGAIAAFEVALARDPEDRDAAANLALVRDVLKRTASSRSDERTGGPGSTAVRETAREDTSVADEEEEVRGTFGEGLAGQREAAGVADAAGNSRVDRRGDPSDASDTDGEGSSKGAAADTAGRAGKSGGPTTSASSDEAPPPPTERSAAELESEQATLQWLASIPDDPVAFVRLRIQAERQRRLTDGTALRIGGSAW